MLRQNREKSAEDVEFELIGGLGNQLFIYFASQYFTSKTGFSASLNLNTIGSGGTNHGRSILDFNLSGNFVESIRRNPFSISERISRKIHFKLPLLKQIFQKDSRVYVSNVLGFDPRLLEVRPGTTVHGYFQSFRYFEYFHAQMNGSIELAHPSEWYVETLKIMKSVNPVVLHIRIGDYLPLRKTFGVLSSEYYKHALKKIDPDGTSTIWVFTDDIDNAKNLLAEGGISNITYICPPLQTSPSESMMLMSFAERIVIGNSTFSWWAATLGSKGKTVIFPKPWFRNSEEPLELFPTNWTATESYWW